MFLLFFAEEIKSIRSLATISLTLTCILFAILVIIAILYHRRKQQIIAGWLRKKLKLKEVRYENKLPFSSIFSINRDFIFRIKQLFINKHEIILKQEVKINSKKKSSSI